MSKWAEVTVTAYKTFLVEVEDNETLDQANQYAMGEAGFGWEADIHESMFVDDVERAKADADEVLSL